MKLISAHLFAVELEHIIQNRQKFKIGANR